MRKATFISPLFLAIILRVLVFADHPYVPTPQVPLAPYPSIEEVIGDARPTWGTPFIADERSFVQTGYEAIVIPTPAELDTDLHIGCVTRQYDPMSGAFVLSVDDNAVTDFGSGSVGLHDNVCFQRSSTLGFLDMSLPL